MLYRIISFFKNQIYSVFSIRCIFNFRIYSVFSQILLFTVLRNPRIGVSHDGHSVWNLHIRDVERSDEGQYMCQINTARAKTRLGNLHVVGELISDQCVVCVALSGLINWLIQWVRGGAGNGPLPNGC